MATSEQKRIVQNLYTANQWSSDQKGNGLALLSLGTTRKIHSETHRKECLTEIADNRAWCVGKGEAKANDVLLLDDLSVMIRQAKVSEEWISDRDNMRINEQMYQDGELK